MKSYRNLLGAAAAALLLSAGCAGTYVLDEPPALRVEVRSEPPEPRAVWIDGHWACSHGRYYWVDGYWERHPRGEWVPGRWERRERGYFWVAGFWRR